MSRHITYRCDLCKQIIAEEDITTVDLAGPNETKTRDREPAVVRKTSDFCKKCIKELRKAWPIIMPEDGVYRKPENL